MDLKKSSQLCRGCVVQTAALYRICFSMCSVLMFNFSVQCSFILLCSWTVSPFSSHGILCSWLFYLFVQVVASHVRREGRVEHRQSAFYGSADFFPWHFIFKYFLTSKLLTLGIVEVWYFTALKLMYFKIFLLLLSSVMLITWCWRFACLIFVHRMTEYVY